MCFILLASKGNGANMLKAGSKRRRTTRQIADQKEEEALKKQAIEDKLARFEELQQKYE